MRNQPPPLTWPRLLTLEAARRQADQALMGLDLAFQRQATPEEVTEALHAASRASAHEHYVRREAPGWN